MAIKETIQNNANTLLTAGGSLASISMEKGGSAFLGNSVTPAVWVLNYLTYDKKPDSVDLALYATGLAGGAAVPASISVGILKSMVDDDIQRKLNQVRESEPEQQRQFIKPCFYEGFSGASISAMTIASKGGTAWLNQNGLWVYITDAKGRHIVDYSPRKFVKKLSPKLPLQKTSTGYNYGVSYGQNY
ncbi:hypothetical protein OLMES_3924 [Oleiphilus messinensis]|uniref:Uncharacterized protein n=1 Tax=Oleiphilus messinensis TaxID=141451 RepID=A0A1Y0IF05_9GAMM|nr:hypothetical protein [Oleiphilus messinensis]ARU57944.1 hypothetical protein OLMES_3924 [Oleiphilus messinensis]